MYARGCARVPKPWHYPRASVRRLGEGSVGCSGMNSSNLAALAVASVSAFAAACSAIVAAVTLLRTRRAQGAQLLFELLREWDSQRMKGVRRRAAASLIQVPSVVDNEVIEILNFFERLGLLINREKVVDKQAAWAAFSDFLLPYYEVTRIDIAEYRDADPTYWEELVHLRDEFMRTTTKRLKAVSRGPSVYDDRVDPADVQNLLNSELHLPDDRQPFEATARVTELPTIKLEATQLGGQ